MKYGVDLKNPIEEWFESPTMIEARGSSHCLLQKRRCLSVTDLNPEKDQLPPDWIIDVLTLGPMSYKGRIRVIIAHCENIAKSQGLILAKPKKTPARGDD